MISIGYEPETGDEHLVYDTDPHPGAHTLSATCPCAPLMKRHFGYSRWIHPRPVPSLMAGWPVAGTMVFSDLYEREKLRADEAEIAARTWRDLAEDRATSVRPYEGSLYRELRHAIVRWRTYRR